MKLTQTKSVLIDLFGGLLGGFLVLAFYAIIIALSWGIPIAIIIVVLRWLGVLPW
jgi:hypothetical protein